MRRVYDTLVISPNQKILPCLAALVEQLRLLENVVTWLYYNGNHLINENFAHQNIYITHMALKVAMVVFMRDMIYLSTY